MLPTGHVAAGFLTAKVLLHFTGTQFSLAETNQLLWWGVFFGFAPDLDVLYFFIKHKTFLVSGKDSRNDSHRKYLSHAPILWIITGLLIFFFVPVLYWKYVGLLLWLGSWSHFLLDSVEYGIMWFWPFSTKVYAFKNTEVKLEVAEQTFIAHSIHFLKLYSTRLSFYLEILIIISAIIVFIN